MTNDFMDLTGSSSMNERNGGWQFYIDRGGTFTDIVAVPPSGDIKVQKLLSEDRSRYRDAAVHGIREILSIEEGEEIPMDRIDSIRMGTTVGTNALLERKGEQTALLITKGFRDLLRIGYQNRPDLFALDIRLPEQLYCHVEEIHERILSDGTISVPLDRDDAKDAFERIKAKGIGSVAIVLMNSYKYPVHETELAGIARDIGFSQISVSYQVSPLMKIVGRGDTTVVDAYLSPILLRYIDSVKNELDGDRDLLFMQSSGGLVDHSLFKGKDCILSGPAGGIVGAVRTSLDAGSKKIITFDMGGTSTDVAHYSGEMERSFETEIAGVRIRAPMLRIHTVAAGGGSILKFEDGRFKVGPDSAGADPGPASYRKGGPLSVTDANLLLGRIQADHFPGVFGKEGNEPLDIDIVRKKFRSLAEEVSLGSGVKRTPEEVAHGFLQVAIENMAQAIKTISTMRGYDVSDHILACFGGAGGQHVCGVADSLGIKKVLIHPLAGVLSAYGMGLAKISVIKERTIERTFDAGSIPLIEELISELGSRIEKELKEQKIEEDDIDIKTRIHLKYSGTDTPIPIEYSGLDGTTEAYEKEHMERFSFIMRGKDLVIETIEVEGIGGGIPTPSRKEEMLEHQVEAHGRVYLNFNNEWTEVPLYQRDRLRPGSIMNGPAVITEGTGTNIVEPGWKASISGSSDLIMERAGSQDREIAVRTDVDPVMLEIFNRLFMSIAEQMGYSLRNTSYSVNIKERLDFSCALFDGGGGLVANAPHIPVHLGSMSDSVRRWLDDKKEMIEPGDTYLINSPYHGGTHLPDVTLITPVFGDDTKKPLFFVASRGHHADIGGKTPGSMPPDSRTIDEEGVLSSGFRIVSSGVFMEERVRDWLTSGKYPARNPDRNISDLKAQIAANEKGQKELMKMVERYSLDMVRSYMLHVQKNAEESVRNVISKLHSGSSNLIMDLGGKISVDIIIDKEGRSVIVDLTGSSDQLDSNFNAPSAVCTAAVLFVFRTLVKNDIPLNKGCLEPIDIRIKKGSMLDPLPPAAVAAGNVETSMFIADALFSALGTLGGSQGTMNNLTFGNERYQYYETICGGTGAGDGFDGTDAVHSHMTNTRITDPEVLEHRYPVVLEEFSIMKGSGGRGRFTGGNGVRRIIRFNEPMTVSIISEHRKVPPLGICGGGPGALGRNTIIRKDGTHIPLDGCGSMEVDEGDLIRIETPGGGGFGRMEVKMS